MKKLIIIFAVTLALFSASVPVQAQCGRLNHRHGNVVHRHYSCYGDKHKHGRSFWSKHRDKLTVGIGAGSGAVIGGLAGGKKGAAIGAVVGGGGAAVYTYGIRKRRKAATYRR